VSRKGIFRQYDNWRISQTVRGQVDHQDAEPAKIEIGNTVTWKATLLISNRLVLTKLVNTKVPRLVITNY